MGKKVLERWSWRATTALGALAVLTGGLLLAIPRADVQAGATDIPDDVSGTVRIDGTLTAGATVKVGTGVVCNPGNETTTGAGGAFAFGPACPEGDHVVFVNGISTVTLNLLDDGEPRVATICIEAGAWDQDCSSAGGGGEDNSTFSIADTSVTEGDTAVLTITRTVSGTPGSVSIVCTPSIGGGSAEAGDFNSGTSVANFDSSDTSATCSVPTNEDADFDNETFQVSISIQQLQTLGRAPGIGDGSATVTILDDDSPPAEPGDISFVSSSSSVNESSPGNKSIAVQRTGGTSGFISAVCTFTNTGTALNGSDFSATVTQTVSWSNGDFSNKNCTYTLNQDTLIEGPETIIVTLSDEQLDFRDIVAPSTHTVTINDDDFEVPPTQIGGVQTVVPTIPAVATPPMPTNTTFPTNTATATNTVKPTDTALPTNTSSAQTNTPTSTPTKPATTASNTAAASNTTGTGGANATPRPPSSGTGTDFGGTNTLAALLLVAIGLGVSGFAATRVTRKG